MLFRRIGDNEFTAIATCHEFVAGERRYRADPNTATSSASDTFPDLSLLVARAAGKPHELADPVLFHGSYFQVLATHPAAGRNKSNGGFVFIAYPAGISGRRA